MNSLEKEQVLDLYNELLEGWNNRNATAMANVFATDGSLVGFDGSHMNGRAEIENHLRPIFAEYPTAEFIKIVREVRFLSPTTALIRAVAGMVPRGHEDINPNVNAIQSLVATKINDKWYVALFQNTPAALHMDPAMREKITQELRAHLKTLYRKSN